MPYQKRFANPIMKNIADDKKKPSESKAANPPYAPITPDIPNIQEVGQFNKVADDT